MQRDDLKISLDDIFVELQAGNLDFEFILSLLEAAGFELTIQDGTRLFNLLCKYTTDEQVIFINKLSTTNKFIILEIYKQRFNQSFTYKKSHIEEMKLVYFRCMGLISLRSLTAAHLEFSTADIEPRVVYGRGMFDPALARQLPRYSRRVWETLGIFAFNDSTEAQLAIHKQPIDELISHIQEKLDSWSARPVCSARRKKAGSISISVSIITLLAIEAWLIYSAVVEYETPVPYDGHPVFKYGDTPHSAYPSHYECRHNGQFKDGSDRYLIYYHDNTTLSLIEINHQNFICVYNIAYLLSAIFVAIFGFVGTCMQSLVLWCGQYEAKVSEQQWLPLLQEIDEAIFAKIKTQELITNLRKEIPKESQSYFLKSTAVERFTTILNIIKQIRDNLDVTQIVVPEKTTSTQEPTSVSKTSTPDEELKDVKINPESEESSLRQESALIVETSVTSEELMEIAIHSDSEEETQSSPNLRPG